MDYIKDAYTSIYGHKDINSYAVVTGKSNVNGGLRNHKSATGAAIYYSIKTLIQNKSFKDVRIKLGLNEDLSGLRVIMNGFGKMGKSAAQFLNEKGVKIIGIQE